MSGYDEMGDVGGWRKGWNFSFAMPVVFFFSITSSSPPSKGSVSLVAMLIPTSVPPSIFPHRLLPFIALPGTGP